MNDTFDESVTPTRTYDFAAPPPPPWRAARVWAGAILLLAGLGLIVLAGCFLIGAIVLIADGLPGENAAAEALFIGLLLVAISCLAGAAILFVYGARGLLRIMNE